jgi:hypothetical protein
MQPGTPPLPPHMDTLSELRQLADDLTALGDGATAALVRKALDRFDRWGSRPASVGYRRPSRSGLSTRHPRPRSPYFNTCVLAVA